MNPPLDPAELAALFRTRAGVALAPDQLTPGAATFEECGVDSLGLLGVVSDLENRYGIELEVTAENCRTPGDLLALVNERAGVA